MGSRMWRWGGPPKGNEIQIILFSLWLVVGWISIAWIGVSAYLIILVILLVSCFFTGVPDFLIRKNNFKKNNPSRHQLNGKFKKQSTALLLAFFLYPLAIGYFYLGETKRAFIWLGIVWGTIFLMSITGLSWLFFIIVFGVVFTMIDCSLLTKKYNKRIVFEERRKEKMRRAEERKKWEQKKKREEEEKRIKEEKRKKYETEMREKGYFKYRGRWLTKEKYEKEKRMDNYIAEKRKTNQFKGCFMVCGYCGYIWQVKKEYGLPAKCVKCNSENIKIDKYKSYGR